MTHEIELEGYYPKILGSPMRMLCLGTKASYGMEVLHFSAAPGGMALRWMSRLLRTPRRRGQRCWRMQGTP